MAVLTKEKVAYAIQTYLMFLNITKTTQRQNASDFETFSRQGVDLLEGVVADRVDLNSALLQLNNLIETTNQYLKAPYPTFVADTSENFIKGEIVAFEHYLNQELKANHLTVQQEAPLFNDSLHLWEKVGVTLNAQEGAHEFATLIEKLNRFLPQAEHYPLPDSEQY